MQAATRGGDSRESCGLYEFSTATGDDLCHIEARLVGLEASSVMECSFRPSEIRNGVVVAKKFRLSTSGRTGLLGLRFLRYAERAAGALICPNKTWHDWSFGYHPWLAHCVEHYGKGKAIEIVENLLAGGRGFFAPDWRNTRMLELENVASLIGVNAGEIRAPASLNVALARAAGKWGFDPSDEPIKVMDMSRGGSGAYSIRIAGLEVGTAFVQRDHGIPFFTSVVVDPSLTHVGLGKAFVRFVERDIFGGDMMPSPFGQSPEMLRIWGGILSRLPAVEVERRLALGRTIALARGVSSAAIEERQKAIKAAMAKASGRRRQSAAPVQA